MPRYPEDRKAAVLGKLLSPHNMSPAYVDESGFAPQPPNRSAWTKKGEVHAITARRNQRLNIIRALLPSGKLVMAKLWQSVNGL